MAGASEPVDVSTKQRRIAELARQSPEMGFTSLAHFIDIDWLREAYGEAPKGRGGGRRRTKWRGLRGGSGEQSPVAAGTSQIRSCQAPPVRRVHIPKGGSATETRPLGIPTFEDKVLQRAVVMVLEAIYEQDFKDCSYGFRPERSARRAPGEPLEADDGDEGWLDRGGRHSKVFRYDRPRTSA